MDISKIKVNNTTYQVKDSGARSLLQSKVGEIEETSYSGLLALKVSSSLVPGQWYRITDYETMVFADNARSANHQFDILVFANDCDKLSENAYAVRHEGDTYFENSNLDAWELKYCLETNNRRFGWCTQYIIKAQDGITDYSGEMFYRDSSRDKSSGIYIYAWSNAGNIDTIYTAVTYTARFTDRIQAANDAGNIYQFNMKCHKGVIYYMKDEFGNECPYDFKNIQIYQEYSQYDSWPYTFHKDTNDTDSSLNGNCFNNIIKPYVYGSVVDLNRIVLHDAGGELCGNTFDYSCYECEVHHNGSFNTFGKRSRKVVVGGSHNTIDSDCYDINLAGEGTAYCSIGKNCGCITFGDENSTKSKYHYITIEPNISYLYLDRLDGTSSYCQNIRVCTGCGGTREEYVHVTVPELDQDQQIVYKNEDRLIVVTESFKNKTIIGPYMWIDDYSQSLREDLGENYRNLGWNYYVEDVLCRTSASYSNAERWENIADTGANLYGYIGSSIERNGVTYYIWKFIPTEQNAMSDNNVQYILTDTIDITTLKNRSLMVNSDSTTVPYVTRLDPDLVEYEDVPINSDDVCIWAYESDELV